MKRIISSTPVVLTITLLTIAMTSCDEPTLDGVEIALAGSGAANPTVAIDQRSGRAYAAWIETTNAGSNVYLASVDSSGRSMAVRVNDIACDAAPHDQAPPQVAVAADGTVVVVWQNNMHIAGRRFPASNLRLARSTDGGRTFEPAVFVNDDAGGAPSTHTFHDVVAATDGTIYVSWIDGRARSSGEHQGHAMHDASLPGSDVRVARSTDGGRTFTTGTIVHRNVCPCCRTSLAAGADGVIAVAFRSADDNIRDIFVARSSDGGMTFAPAVRVHEDGWQVDACPHAGASLALDDDGRMHIAWYTGAAERQGLWYAVSSPDGGSFGQPVPLQTGGWVPVSQVKLATSADGVAWIAWDDRREAQSTIHLATAHTGTVREIPLSIRGRSPAIAADDLIVLAWQQDSTAAVRLLRSR